MEGLSVSVNVLESEVKKDPDAYAKRLITGYLVASSDGPKNCMGFGVVNGEAREIVFP